uniref:Uncharacterized protein n=1 Tax=Lepeophtheirus salmonis TaxID=72036 RepID=A0A0K2U0U2_LEPSM
MLLLTALFGGLSWRKGFGFAIFEGCRSRRSSLAPSKWWRRGRGLTIRTRRA